MNVLLMLKTENLNGFGWVEWLGLNNLGLSLMVLPSFGLPCEFRFAMRVSTFCDFVLSSHQILSSLASTCKHYEKTIGGDPF